MKLHNDSSMIDLEQDDAIGEIIEKDNFGLLKQTNKMREDITSRNARRNKKARLGWIAVNNEITATKGFDQGYIQPVPKYPIFCIYKHLAR